jgi:hypothetical protein
MVGFPTAATRAGYFFAMVLVTELYSVTLGMYPFLATLKDKEH